MKGGRLRFLVARFRNWPIHPQWLLNTEREKRDLSQALSGFAGTVLDIGCADGRLARMLPPGCRYIGVDYPDTAVGMYRTRPAVFADAGRLPFADASVDCAILKDVLEHVRRPEAALAEIARVVRPGGKLLLWIPFLYPIHDAPHDYQRFTEHGLATYLASDGFEVDRIKPVLRGVETAGLMASLALADACEQIVARKPLLVPMVPVLATLVLIVNLAARGFAWLPATNFMPAFYRLVAVRRNA